MSDLPIIQKTYDLIKWYVPILNRLPRNHKFLLGDRMIAGLYDLLENLLKAQKYVRYVDDFALFSDDQSYLTEARQAIEDYLAALRLKIHPIKSQIFATQHGANFLGFRIFPDRIRVRTESLKRARRRLRLLQARYACYQAGIPEIVQSIQSWEAHLKHGDTWRLRRQIFNSLVFSRR